jgi:hypothetical protein
VTTWDEHVAAHPAFRLVGGPLDGKDVDARGYSAWPSFIRMVVMDKPGRPYKLARYRMRIGDLEHYDFDGLEDAK